MGKTPDAGRGPTQQADRCIRPFAPRCALVTIIDQVAIALIRQEESIKVWVPIDGQERRICSQQELGKNGSEPVKCEFDTVPE